MAIFKIEGPVNGEAKQLFDDIEKQENSVRMAQIPLSKLKQLRVSEYGLECYVNQKAFEQCRKEFNKAMDQMWNDYERLRELGIVIIQAHE